MNHAIHALCILISLAGNALAETIGGKCDLKSVVSIEVAEEHRSGPNQEHRYFSPRKMNFSKPDEVEKIKGCIATSSLEAPGMSPFFLVGDFCHLILRDKADQPLYLVTIVNYHCVCEIRRATTDLQGRIAIDESSQDIYGFVSGDLLKHLCSAIKMRDRKYLDKVWSTPNPQELLEHEVNLLTPDERAGERAKDSEQDTAGQPAARPESKAGGSDKPQPEVEGRSR